MTPDEAVLYIRSPAVVHDTIDGEVLVINLETGSYYTLEGAGAAVWQELCGGPSLAAVRASVAERLHQPLLAVTGSVDRLLAELSISGLVGGIDEGALAADAEAVYPELTLRAYDELQDLLLIDPIHEVDAAGWPHRAPTSP